MNWPRWCMSPVRRPASRRRTRLAVEHLEDRSVPATFIWSGAGADDNWSTDANWQGGLAPSAGSDLDFPSGAARLTNNNDTSLLFNSLTVDVGGYTINGQTINLAGNLVANNPSGSTVVVGPDIALQGAGGTTQQITVTNSGANLQLTNSITAPLGAGLNKTGAGSLFLISGNNSYNGPIDIAAGVVQIDNDAALGNSGQGIVVEDGAQLQLSGGITVTGQPLSLLGSGISNSGALMAFNNSNSVNTWAGPITLAGNAALGSLTLLGAPFGLAVNSITDNGSGFRVNIVGGTVQYVGSTANTYTGSTTVTRNAQLELGKTAGAQAFGGDLVVGDGVTTGSVTWLTPNQIQPNTVVTVKAGSSVNLNDQPVGIGTLDITDGTVTTGNSNATVQQVATLTITGGTVTLNSTLQLTGDLSGSSDANGRANINGIGAINLPAGAHLFNITPGSLLQDMRIQTAITGLGDVAKNGNGRLILDGAGTYGTTTINGGDVEVNGTIGAVSLAGGGLSGTGTVASITGPGNAAAGFLAPGQNVPPISFSLLNVTSDANLGASTTFTVDLSNGQANGAPLPGTDYDVLKVGGNAVIDGAILAGSSNANVRPGDTFAILQATGNLTGRLAQLVNATPTPINDGDQVSINGVPYILHYLTHEVDLTRANSVAVQLGSSVQGVNVSYGEDAIYTATVTAASGPIPGAATVTFTLDKGTAQQQTSAPLALDANGKASFDPQQQFGVWAVGSTHTIDVLYDDHAGTTSAATQLAQQVGKNSVNIVLQVGTFIPGQPLQATVTLSPVVTLLPGASNPTGNIQFKLDEATPGEQQFQATIATPTPAPPDPVQVTVTLPNFGGGSHSLEASYVGVDNNYLASFSPAFAFFTAKTPTTTTLTSTGNAAAGQPVTFTATVAGTGMPGPTGSVFFVVDGASQSAVSLAGGVASFTTSSLAPGLHQVSAGYAGDQQFASSASATVAVTIGSGAGSTIATAIPIPSVTQAQQVINQTLNAPAGAQLFSFDAQAGQTIEFTCQATSNQFDSVVRIFDAQGNQIAIATPLTLVSGVATFRFKFAQTGKFVIGISGYPNVRYNPVTGAGGVAGSTGAYTLTVNPNPPSLHQHDTLAKATTLGAASKVRQISDYQIADPTDVAIFRLTAKARQQATIIVGRPQGSSLAPVLRLFNAQGKQIAASPSGVLTFKFKSGGTYYIGVSGKGNGAYDPVTGDGQQPGSSGGFTIALTPGAPAKGSRNSRLDQAAKLGNLTRARNAAGALRSTGAVQIFSFGAAGGQTIAFDVQGHAGQTYLRLFDGNGIELASSRGARLVFTFPITGTYFLGVSSHSNTKYDAVTGTGNANGTSTTRFAVTLTPQGAPRPLAIGPTGTPGPLPYDSTKAAVAGVVYFDQNGSGQPTPDARGESAHMVFLDRNNNNVRDDGEPATFTNAQGQFLINAAPGKAPVFAAPVAQFGIPVEKVTGPQQGFYTITLASRKVVVRVAFGMSRFEG